MSRRWMCALRGGRDRAVQIDSDVSVCVFTKEPRPHSTPHSLTRCWSPASHPPRQTHPAPLQPPMQFSGYHDTSPPSALTAGPSRHRARGSGPCIGRTTASESPRSTSGDSTARSDRRLLRLELVDRVEPCRRVGERLAAREVVDRTARHREAMAERGEVRGRNLLDGIIVGAVLPGVDHVHL